VQKRVSWARSYAQASGLQNVPYLSNDELKAVRDRVGQGPVGQLEVAADLRKSFGVAVGTEVAKQVDRNDKGLQLMIGLVPQAAELYRKGIDALQRNPKLFAGGEGDADRAREIFNEYAVGIPPELRTPVLNVARGITAAAGDTEHRSSLEGDEFEATFRNAIHRAAGQIGVGDDRTGGFVNWMGRRAWLPPTMGQREFQQRLSRAGPNEWKQPAAARLTTWGRTASSRRCPMISSSSSAATRSRASRRRSISRRRRRRARRRRARPAVELRRSEARPLMPALVDPDAALHAAQPGKFKPADRPTRRRASDRHAVR
jgi:hypothetical protein